ncbi:cell division ATP-binding protein FtsE [Candidatus Shapirobacteria bacterium CG09_land_8_20_14_0_10_49_15]|uniref:Cell division ATP-binding protein FtsE n=2 Tax=Candidatus Shapironibacteriota TaxID=1752721 RepID=A0A2M8L716_9BACT|nr:MAG: cell division ATP-binding protein FtsE [Candidatus Shapirobacteria bacterium CG09_land_8_20_14_0_10_49_15]PJE70040.1 MAG: cell division ATP-binding protein FtsE [Candidatus Shapirobacteria bacterium CG10_big_fil_rev_8_21_14_0_10_48_15]
MIKFDKVTKKFGSITALSAVSFEIPKNSFVFIVGPSGAGKSTIVHLLLREYLPTSGKIKVSKQDLAKLTKKELVALRRQIGVVFQDFKLLADRTVFENVALPLKFVKNDAEQIGKEVRQVLKLVGLTERAALFPAQLAGGELQRACLARAIVNCPEIVIADEPTGNLDPQTAVQIVDLLKKVNEMGSTVIIATHNAQIVNQFNQRVIALAQGELISDQPESQYPLTK